MKHFILLSLLFSISSVFSQDGIKIKISTDSTNTDYSSGHSPYTVTSENTSDFNINLVVSNNTGTDQNWRVIRWRESDVPSTWTDAVCFGINCFNPSTDNPWCSSPEPQNALIIPNGETKTVFFHPTPDGFSPATFKIYIGNDCNDLLDSVTLAINYTNDISEISEEHSFRLSPNPANEFVSLKEIPEGKKMVRIVDMTGKTLIEETVTSSSDITVSKLENGIYYVILEENGMSLYSEKLVIKH